MLLLTILLYYQLKIHCRTLNREKISSFLSVFRETNHLLFMEEDTSSVVQFFCIHCSAAFKQCSYYRRGAKRVCEKSNPTGFFRIFIFQQELVIREPLSCRVRSFCPRKFLRELDLSSLVFPNVAYLRCCVWCF